MIIGGSGANTGPGAGAGAVTIHFKATPLSVKLLHIQVLHNAYRHFQMKKERITSTMKLFEMIRHELIL